MTRTRAWNIRALLSETVGVGPLPGQASRTPIALEAQATLQRAPDDPRSRPRPRPARHSRARQAAAAHALHRGGRAGDGPAPSLTAPAPGRPRAAHRPRRVLSRRALPAG